MSQVKIRIWDNDTKKMYVEDENHNPADLLTYALAFPNTETMLYSTLPDKNGQKICEGDIMDSLSGNKFIVVFEHGCFMLQHIGDDHPREYLYEGASSFWVIGNIHDGAPGVPALDEMDYQNRT